MGEPSCGHAQLLYSEYIAVKRHTQGTETSKYLEEKKTRRVCLRTYHSDSVSSGERTRRSPNLIEQSMRGCRTSEPYELVR